MDCTDRRLGALASPSVTRRRSCNNGVWRPREQQPTVLLWVLTLEKFAFEVAAGVTCPCNTRGVFARQCLLSGGKAPPARGVTRAFGPTSTAHPLKRGGAQTEWHSYSPPPIFCYRPVTNGRIRVGSSDRNGRNPDAPFPWFVDLRLFSAPRISSKAAGGAVKAPHRRLAWTVAGLAGSPCAAATGAQRHTGTPRNRPAAAVRPKTRPGSPAPPPSVRIRTGRFLHRRNAPAPAGFHPAWGSSPFVAAEAGIALRCLALITRASRFHTRSPLGNAFYPVPVCLLAASLHASYPHSVALMHCASLRSL